MFGASKAKAIANEYAIPAIARMPLDSKIATLADNGRIEDYENTSALQDIFEQIQKVQPKKIDWANENE